MKWCHPGIRYGSEKQNQDSAFHSRRKPTLTNSAIRAVVSTHSRKNFGFQVSSEGQTNRKLHRTHLIYQRRVKAHLILTGFKSEIAGSVSVANVMWKPHRQSTRVLYNHNLHSQFFSFTFNLLPYLHSQQSRNCHTGADYLFIWSGNLSLTVTQKTTEHTPMTPGVFNKYLFWDIFANSNLFFRDQKSQFISFLSLESQSFQSLL